MNVPVNARDVMPHGGGHIEVSSANRGLARLSRSNTLRWTNQSPNHEKPLLAVACMVLKLCCWWRTIEACGVSPLVSCKNTGTGSSQRRMARQRYRSWKNCTGGLTCWRLSGDARHRRPRRIRRHHEEIPRRDLGDRPRPARGRRRAGQTVARDSQCDRLPQGWRVAAHAARTNRNGEVLDRPPRCTTGASAPRTPRPTISARSWRRSPATTSGGGSARGFTPASPQVEGGWPHTAGKVALYLAQTQDGEACRLPSEIAIGTTVVRVEITQKQERSDPRGTGPRFP